MADHLGWSRRIYGSNPLPIGNFFAANDHRVFTAEPRGDVCKRGTLLRAILFEGEVRVWRVLENRKPEIGNRKCAGRQIPGRAQTPFCAAWPGVPFDRL